MKTVREALRLYAVTDRAWLFGRTLEEDVRKALEGGVTMVQLREKTLGRDAVLQEAITLEKLCAEYDVPFIVNDDVELCVLSGADGVHVGQDDTSVTEARRILGDRAIIGATAHNVAEAVKAMQLGADYLGVGAAFGSSTKKDAKAIDPAQYKVITASVDIPVCAIGGIHAGNAGLLCGSGLAGLAVVSGIFAAEDITAAAKELYRISGQL